MQAHHRQQRKKQLQRNKEQRIKARDEKVVQTKTISSVKEEIFALKKRGKNLQPGEVQKLQRLEKELKRITTCNADTVGACNILETLADHRLCVTEH